jgi:hypothetical protein
VQYLQRVASIDLPGAGGDAGEDLVVDGVGVSGHLIVGAVLDGVRHEHPRRGDAKRSRLGIGCGHKRAGRNEDTGDTPAFQITDVVHTARRTAASIGQCFDDDVAGDRDLVA